MVLELRFLQHGMLWMHSNQKSGLGLLEVKAKHTPKLPAMGLEIDVNVQGLGRKDKENPEQGPRRLKVSDVDGRLRGSGWVGRRSRKPPIGLRRSRGGV